MDWKRIGCTNCSKVYKVEHVVSDEWLQCHACGHRFKASEGFCAPFSMTSIQPTSSNASDVKDVSDKKTRPIPSILKEIVEKQKKQVFLSSKEIVNESTKNKVAEPLKEQISEPPLQVSEEAVRQHDVMNQVIEQKELVMSFKEKVEDISVPPLDEGYDSNVWGDTDKPKHKVQVIFSKILERVTQFLQKQEYLLVDLKRRFRHFNGKPWLLGVGIVLLLLLMWLATKDSLLNEPQSRSMLMQLQVSLKLKDTDWRVDEGIVFEWVESKKGRDILLIKGVIENRLNVKLPLPFIRIRMYAESDPERLIKEYVLPMKKVNDRNILSTLPDDLPMDLDMMSSLEKRHFTLVVQNVPYDVGHITLRPTLRTPKQEE